MTTIRRGRVEARPKSRIAIGAVHLTGAADHVRRAGQSLQRDVERFVFPLLDVILR
jgi:hypothetical protein